MRMISLVYISALIAILAFGVRSACLAWRHASLAVFLLFWVVLILTAHILSPFSAINVTSAYVVVSLLIAGGIAVGLRYLKADRAITFPTFVPSFPFSPRLAALLGGLLAVTLLLAAIVDLILAYGFLPTNPDSIVYRFSRAYWYFGHGSLAHFTNHAEPRPLYYPFNGAMAFMPLIHFRFGPRSFALVSLLCWFVVGFATYLFSRDLGGSRLGALATTWLVCLTPNILLQGLSTNDEIIAATPLLVGLFFLHRWFRGRQHFDALLGALGVGISAGIKLHISFYWPVILIAALIAAINYRESLKELRSWMTVRGIAVGVIMCASVAIFAFSFIAYNYVSAGRATAWDFHALVLNTPFSWRAGLQNVLLYSAQVILTPVADIQIATDSSLRALHYEAFNRIFSPLFGWVNNSAEFVSVSYRFSGINSASSVAFNEHTLFIGFTWIVALLALILVWRRSQRQFLWGRLHVISLPLWFLTFAAGTKYIEGFTVYLGYATIVVGPALVYAFLPIQNRRRDECRWFIILFVMATHCYFALSIFLTSSPRNLIVLARAQTWPMSRGFLIDESIREELARAKDGIYSHTIAWGQPHWAFMADNPHIRQFLASNPQNISVPADEPSDPTSVALRYSRYVVMPASGSRHLHVYSFPQLTAYGYAIPIRIPDRVESGLTLIGSLMFSLGPEWVFAAGNEVEARHPGNDRYLVLKYDEITDFGHASDTIIRLSPTVYGLGRRDDLSFRFELWIDGKVIGDTEWSGVPAAEFKTEQLKGDNGILTVMVRNNEGGSVYSVHATLRSTKALPLVKN